MFFIKTEEEKINGIFSKINNVYYFNKTFEITKNKKITIYLCSDKIMKDVIKKLPRSFEKFLDCGYGNKNKTVLILFDVVDRFIFDGTISEIFKFFNMDMYYSNYHKQISYFLKTIYNLKKLYVAYFALKYGYYSNIIVENNDTLVVNNVNIKPDYYLNVSKEKSDMNHLYKIEFEPEVIKTLEFKYDDSFNLISVKVYPGKEHPNVDDFGDYCLGNKKYKELTSKLIGDIINDIKIYNLTSFYKIPDIMYKHLYKE